MSGLTADARTLVDHARVEAQALWAYDFFRLQKRLRCRWTTITLECAKQIKAACFYMFLLLSCLFCFLCGLEVLICS